MSIDIPSFMAADDINPQKWVTTPRWIGSVRLEVEVLRRLQLKVGFDPLPNKQCSDENPYHGEVWGEFSKRVKREIANHANWFVEIPDADVA